MSLIKCILVRETDIEAELVTLQNELSDAKRRLAESDDESRTIILNQITQIRRDIARYSRNSMKTGA